MKIPLLDWARGARVPVARIFDAASRAVAAAAAQLAQAAAAERQWLAAVRSGATCGRMLPDAARRVAAEVDLGVAAVWDLHAWMQVGPGGSGRGRGRGGGGVQGVTAGIVRCGGANAVRVRASEAGGAASVSVRFARDRAGVGKKS